MFFTELLAGLESICGWRAADDSYGKWFNYGVQIPAGNHEIKFAYQENSYLIGAGITFITYVSLVAAYFVERRRKYASADKKV